MDWQTLLSGAVLYGTLAYAARTVPAVKNPWARWIIGIVQYALSNADKGKAMLTIRDPTDTDRDI